MEEEQIENNTEEIVEEKKEIQEEEKSGELVEEKKENNVGIPKDIAENMENWLDQDHKRIITEGKKI